ncbi:MAG: isocitrate/isopropylmalate dehydrogenase family protein [Gemmatimonadota bacterium]|jgi:3-isopropylmalate dehydrogenase
MKRIALIPGDGVGAEVTAQAVKILERLAERNGLPLVLEAFEFGADRFLETGVAITDAEMARLEREFDAILLGAIGDPRVPGNEHAREILLGLRFRLDLYINLRPARLYEAWLSPLRDVRAGDIDIVIFRENTEGIYVGMGGSLRQGTPHEVAIEEDINTRRGVERIVTAAFEHARRTGRRRVTLTDKANAMPHTGGLWRRIFAEVGAGFAELEREAVYVDALALDLVRRPARYDVIVAPNLFGDILSDLAAALVGGLGLAPSANLHPGRPGLFEPVHGSAPDIAGTGRVNPIAMLLAVALMLAELGWPSHAARLESAIRSALGARRVTPDLGGVCTTDEVGDWICSEMSSLPLVPEPERDLPAGV